MWKWGRKMSQIESEIGPRTMRCRKYEHAENTAHGESKRTSRMQSPARIPTRISEECVRKMVCEIVLLKITFGVDFWGVPWVWSGEFAVSPSVRRIDRPTDGMEAVKIRSRSTATPCHQAVFSCPSNPLLISILWNISVCTHIWNHQVPNDLLSYFEEILQSRYLS